MRFFLRSQQAFQPSLSLTVEALLTTLVGLNERMVEAVAVGGFEDEAFVDGAE